MQLDNFYLTKENFDDFLSYIRSEDPFKKTGKSENVMRPWEFKLLFKLLYGSALSIQQVLNLENRDLDLSFRIVTVRSSYYGKTNVKKATLLPSHVASFRTFTKTKRLTDKLFETEPVLIVDVANMAISKMNLSFSYKSGCPSATEQFWTKLFRNSCVYRMRKAGASEELITRKLSHTEEKCAEESRGESLRRLLDWEAKNE